MLSSKRRPLITKDVLRTFRTRRLTILPADAAILFISQGISFCMDGAIRALFFHFREDVRLATMKTKPLRMYESIYTLILDKANTFKLHFLYRNYSPRGNISRRLKGKTEAERSISPLGITPLTLRRKHL